MLSSVVPVDGRTWFLNRHRKCSTLDRSSFALFALIYIELVFQAFNHHHSRLHLFRLVTLCTQYRPGSCHHQLSHVSVYGFITLESFVCSFFAFSLYLFLLLFSLSFSYAHSLFNFWCTVGSPVRQVNHFIFHRSQCFHSQSNFRLFISFGKMCDASDLNTWNNPSHRNDDSLAALINFNLEVFVSHDHLS